MRCLLYIPIIVFFTCQSNDERVLSPETTKWIHGSTNCAENIDPTIQIVRFNASTWILRQNKCVHYEAPFIFLFLGDQKALLVDTGATSDEATFPLSTTVEKIVRDWELLNKTTMELVVAHTHNHSDHRSADIQFKDRPNTIVVSLKPEDIAAFFHFQNWPNETAVFELGNRALEIIPIPGHEPSSIAFYDPSSKWLLTGDTFYPGRLYVRDWPAFKLSIQRLVNFSSSHEIDYLLGNHIEMSTTPHEDYPEGTVYQPDEHALPLYVKDLIQLNDGLKMMGDYPQRKVFDQFIVYPLNQP